MIIVGMTRDNTNRVDTTATNAAQAVLEEIAGTPTNTSPTITVKDCLGNALQINTAGSAGAPLDPVTGEIDWKQGAVPGYQMNYTVCGSANNIRTVYDVRWHVTLVGPGNTGRLVVVSARQPFVANSKGIGFITPVTLRTIVGQ